MTMDEFVDVLLGKGKKTTLMHEHPDCDSVTTALLLKSITDHYALYTQIIAKDLEVIRQRCTNEIAGLLQTISPPRSITAGTVIVVDGSTLEATGLQDKVCCPERLVFFDNHLQGICSQDYFLVESAACVTGAWQILQTLGIPFPTNKSQKSLCALAALGVLCDSGWFPKLCPDVWKMRKPVGRMTQRDYEAFCWFRERSDSQALRDLLCGNFFSEAEKVWNDLVVSKGLLRKDGVGVGNLPEAGVRGRETPGIIADMLLFTYNLRISAVTRSCAGQKRISLRKRPGCPFNIAKFLDQACTSFGVRDLGQVGGGTLKKRLDPEILMQVLEEH